MIFPAMRGLGARIAGARLAIVRGVSQESVGRLELTDNAGNGSSVFASETLKIATGVGIRFELGTSNNFSYSDSFSVQLQRWDGSAWVNVGVAVTSTGTINSGALAAGDYRYVFTVTDVKQAWWDDSAATLRIDNLNKVTYPPVGQPDIINTADQLKAVLVGSSTTNTPAEVGPMFCTVVLATISCSGMPSILITCRGARLATQPSRQIGLMVRDLMV